MERLSLNGNTISSFKEKSKLDEGWINGGFFVMEPKFLNYIKSDQTFLEREPLEKLVKKGNYPLLNIMVFGIAWTPKETKTILKKFLKKENLKFE